MHLLIVTCYIKHTNDTQSKGVQTEEIHLLSPNWTLLYWQPLAGSSGSYGGFQEWYHDYGDRLASYIGSHWDFQGWFHDSTDILAGFIWHSFAP